MTKYYSKHLSFNVLLLWHCWLGGRRGIQPVKNWAGMVICLERDADLHIAQMMPLPLTVSCFSKTQIAFTFLVPAHLGSPGKRAVKGVCVCATSLQICHSICWWKYFKNLWTFGKGTGKMVDCVIRPIRLHVCPQRCRTRQISKITCV